jgi:hypothetical protein
MKAINTVETCLIIIPVALFFGAKKVRRKPSFPAFRVGYFKVYT